MDFWQSIKYQDQQHHRFPIIRLNHIILHPRWRKSTTQEPREVAFDESMGSAVIKTEGMDSVDRMLDKGTSLILQYKGVTLIT